MAPRTPTPPTWSRWPSCMVFRRKSCWKTWNTLPEPPNRTKAARKPC